MEVNKNSMIFFSIGILIGMFIVSIVGSKFNGEGGLIDKPDTTYNKIKLDSIKVQIGKHDTTIYKLNIKLKDDVEKSYALSDSATVDMFKQLATSTGKE